MTTIDNRDDGTQETGNDRSDTEPAPPPWAAAFMREIKEREANMQLALNHIASQVKGLDGGIRMLIGCDEETHRKLGRIESTVDAVVQHLVGLRVATSDLRARVEQLEQDAHSHSNGAALGE